MQKLPVPIHSELIMKKIIFTLILGILFTKGPAQPAFTKNFSDTIDNGRIKNVIATETSIYLTGLSFLNFIWYQDHERVDFHYYNDLKGYLQMDKLGHAFGAYYESYQGYYALRWAGLSKRKSLIYGAPLGIIFQTPIEIFDGVYEGYGFSWWDFWANNVGTALFTFQEAFWDKQYVMMKFSYSPSGYPKYHDILGESSLESLFLDYNGHTYWLSGNLKDISGINEIPGWLNFAFGYSGNGMIKEFENPEYYQGEPFPELPRYRQYLFSLDIDLSKIQTEKRWLRSLLKHLNFIKVPFPALEYSNENGLEFKPLYF